MAEFRIITQGCASWRLAWLAVSFVFASNYFPVTKLLAYTPLNFVQSYLFASALKAYLGDRFDGFDAHLCLLGLRRRRGRRGRRHGAL